MGVGGQCHVPAALPPGKRRGIHCTGGWGGSVRTGAENFAPTVIRSPDRPNRVMVKDKLVWFGFWEFPFERMRWWCQTFSNANQNRTFPISNTPYHDSRSCFVFSLRRVPTTNEYERTSRCQLDGSQEWPSGNTMVLQKKSPICLGAVVGCELVSRGCCGVWTCV
jgi:hypothetical protein